MNTSRLEHVNTRTLPVSFSILLVLLSSALIASPRERLRLIHADELENIADAEGNAVQYLRGNVKFKKGEATITAQRATYRDREGVGTFSPAVTMERNEQILTSDSLIFDSKNDKITGLGHIHFTDGEYDLVCDTLTYFLEADSGIASNNVHFRQKKQKISADRLVYHKREDAEAASYTAMGNVVITEENRQATCGRSIYDAADESSILLEDPVVIQEGQNLSGNEIRLYYTDDVLYRVIIPDRSHITYRSSGKVKMATEPDDTSSAGYQLREFLNDMTGRRLEAYLIDGRLDSVRLEGMATTLYHLFEDSLYQGKNIASGDTITLLFGVDSAGSEDLETIHIVGGSRGEYDPDESSEEIDAPIIYRADTIHYAIPDQETVLKKSAQIDYKDTQLKSGIISVSWENDLLHALPSAHELPTVIEKGRDPMIGQWLEYNLATGRGRVGQGKTKLEDGYYRGREIRNRTRDTFFVRSGIYTTCDLEPEPHFHFESHRMKMILEDKIIAKPIVFYVAGIPLFALPFGVIPDQAGRRHSGWILPSYGETNRQGRFLEGIGYFWAVNDYWNSQFTLDFYDRQGIVFRSGNRYFKRYAYSGGLNFRYNRTVATRDIADIFESPGAIRWSVAWNHSQKLRHNQSLNVNARYYNDSRFNRKLGIHRDTRLDQKAISNATYSKNWRKYNTSISVNLSETRNLMAEAKIDPQSLYYETPTRLGMRIIETSSVLPSLTIRRGQTQLFTPSLYFSYGSTLRNRGTGFYETDSVRVDSIRWNPLRHQRWDNRWAHSISLSGSRKLFKYISVHPSLSVSEGWITKYFDADSVDTGGKPIDRREISQFRARHTASFSLSANTKLYGLFPIRIGSLRAVRHTLTPSIGFSYQPDYSKRFFGYDFGYFKTLKDSVGNEHLFDPFSGTAIGSTPRQERKNLNISIKNVLQAKVRKGEKERKIDRILTWNMSTRYNFAAKQFKFERLNSSIRARFPRKMNLDFSMTHDFYDIERDGGSFRRVDRLATNEWGIPTPRLVRASAATGFRLSGNRLQRLGSGTAGQDTTGLDTSEADRDLTATRSVKFETTGKGPMEGGNLWNLGVNLRYTANRFDPTNPRDDFWMNTNLTVQLTKSWRVKYTARFDLLKRDVISHDIYIYRDLHCWELTFTWTPGGLWGGYYLKINIKSPTLSDLKVESRGGRWQGPRI